MNRRLILFFIAILNATFCTLSCYSQEAAPSLDKKDLLSKKVVRMTLNQSEPAEVKIGLEGITTLEFPAKIETIQGYGFAVQPKPETDYFQLTFEKGTNFLSLKALRPGVCANLTVVLNERVYCIYCEEDTDPSFVVIFAAPGENGQFVATGESQPVVFDKKTVSHDQLLNFLDKVKGYEALKTSSPDAVASLKVAEPQKSGKVAGIQTVIKRVVSDESLGLVGFEVELGNRTQQDFYFDPDGFSVRTGDATYEACISDAGGIVPVGTSVPAFFVTTTHGGPTDLAVDGTFDLQLRPAQTPTNGDVAAAHFAPPPDHLAVPASQTKEGGKKGSKPRKGNSAKGEKEPKKKAKEVADSANDQPPNKEELAGKKHWYDIFKRNNVMAAQQ